MRPDLLLLNLSLLPLFVHASSDFAAFFAKHKEAVQGGNSIDLANFGASFRATFGAYFRATFQNAIQ